jgi:hypothetical protein
MQNLKLLLLKSDTYLVAQVEEIVADYGMPNCKLIQPFQVNGIYDPSTGKVDLQP